MPNDDDDIPLKSYQDDLTTDDNATDPIMDEEGEDPTRELGIPVAQYKEELDKLAIDDLPDDEIDAKDLDITLLDDEREYMEDVDESDNSDAIPGVPR